MKSLELATQLPPEATRGWARTRGGLYVPKSGRRAQWGPRPLAIDLFAGAGGFSLGLIQAGWRVVGALDNDSAAAVTYTHNLGTYPMQFHFVDGESDRERLEREILRDQKRGELVGMPLTGHGWIANQPEDVLGCPHFWFGDVRKVTGAQILEALGCVFNVRA